jgi:hypothetical protein
MYKPKRQCLMCGERYHIGHIDWNGDFFCDQCWAVLKTITDDDRMVDTEGNRVSEELYEYLI